jgi:hypothetical protein
VVTCLPGVRAGMDRGLVGKLACPGVRARGRLSMPSKVTVVVIAPFLGHDLQWIADVDPRVEVIDGSRTIKYSRALSVFRYPKYESGRHGCPGRGSSREHAVDVCGCIACECTVMDRGHLQDR